MQNIAWRDFSFSGNYINGRFVIPEHPNSYVDKRDPGNTKDLIVSIPVYFPHAEEAVQSAKDVFEKWSSLDGKTRLEMLGRLKNSLEMLSPWLVELTSRELGRPIWDSKQEVELALNDINELFRQFGSYTPFDGSVLDDSKEVIQLYKPNGVVAVIAPFNQPVLYPIRSIVSSLLIGNTVVYKPSEHTPLVGQVIAEAVHHAELPSGVFNMVLGEKEISKRIIKHHGVYTVFFNGTFETATKISQYISDDYWKILVMGTGGKNASVILSDADIDSAVNELVFGAFVSAGQRSNGIRRIFVHRDLADQFIDKFHKKSKKLRVGHPLDEYRGKRPFMGPLISENAMQNYLRLQGISQREGAEVLMRGKEIDIDTGYKGYYVTPSIHLTDEIDEKGIYNTSEIFGPNVSIKRFSAIEEAIASHNTCEYGYGLSVFGHDNGCIKELVRNCNVGQVFLNSITLGESVHYPIAGYGKSGNSRPEGSYNSLYLRRPVTVYRKDSVSKSIQNLGLEDIKEF